MNHNGTLTPKRIYEAMLRRAVKGTFAFWQTLGIHVALNHFYEPIPDTRKLNGRLWSKNSDLVGIDINEAQQLQLLSRFESSFKDEYDRFPRTPVAAPHVYHVNNGMFESVDGEILYCMIRHFKPAKIIEIGSGYSTCLSAQAALRNKQENDRFCELIAIEPYPNKNLTKGFPGLTRLVTKKVEDVPVTYFQQLKENDILFIDSSHTLKIGGDVQYEYLEILPRLNKGVIVCFHDIFLPAEYRKEWILKRHYFWNEQYLLQGFLTYNDSFEVLWAASYTHLKHPDKLQKAFASYDKERCWPGCFWIRKTK